MTGSQIIMSDDWASVMAMEGINITAADEIQSLAVWETPVGTATDRGIGQDNPADPYSGTDLQRQRSLMVSVAWTPTHAPARVPVAHSTFPPFHTLCGSR